MVFLILKPSHMAEYQLFGNAKLFSRFLPLLLVISKPRHINGIINNLNSPRLHDVPAKHILPRKRRAGKAIIRLPGQSLSEKAGGDSL